MGGESFMVSRLRWMHKLEMYLTGCSVSGRGGKGKLRIMDVCELLKAEVVRSHRRGKNDN